MSEEKKNVPEQETEKEPEVQETPQEETRQDKKKLSERKLRAELDKAEKRAAEAENKLKHKQQELDDTIRLLQRNQADFDNFRKRNASLRQETQSFRSSLW